MMEDLLTNGDFIYTIATIAILLILFIIWIVFLDHVPKHLKGIEYQLMKLNDTLEAQKKSEITYDSIRAIVRETVKEMNEDNHQGDNR